MHFLRYLLYPFALIFMAVSVVRRWLYQKGIFKRQSFNIPVICVGNLSIGGTGKSPMVVYLSRLLSPYYNVATLSRGYGRKTTGFRKVEPNDTAENTGDEPLMFAHELPDAKIFVGEDRCAAIDNIQLKHAGVNLILLDDAYQHMRVKAGLNIIITRYDSPFWKDHVLPVGKLREPANGAERAQVVVITGCPENMSEADKNNFSMACKKYTSAPVFFAAVKYAPPVAVSSVVAAPVWDVYYDSVLVISGIARPQPFQQYALRYAALTHTITFADHHLFTEADVQKIIEKYNSLQGKKAILTTAKDRARMLTSKPCLNMLNQIQNVFYQPMELTILGDSKKFDQIILHYAQKHS
jgi:tetraacyldisaccharide 4'-kinase